MNKFSAGYLFFILLLLCCCSESFSKPDDVNPANTGQKGYQEVINSKTSTEKEVDFALLGLAQTQYIIGQYDKAIVNAQKGLILARQLNSDIGKIRALRLLAESYAAIKDYPKAYTYQVIFKKTSDSIVNIENNLKSINSKQQLVYNARLQDEIKAKEQSIAFSKKLLLFRNMIAVCVIVFIIIVIRSNRQKTALNKELQKLNASIALQKEEIFRQKENLRQLNHTKDQLFSVISHDLRSPFAAILQVMDNMNAIDISEEEFKEILNVFYRQVRQVTAMVNNLLVWAVSQQSGVKTELVTLDVTVVVNEIISLAAFFSANKAIKLQHNNDGGKWIWADLDHVRIIIQNLVGNAIKFTPDGGTVEIFYTADEEYQAIHVRDNGIGMLPQKIDKLFKVTGKEISEYGTNNEVGAGIGLALIKQFVEADNGKLDVQSKQGDGSEFTVYLKRAVAV